MASDQAFEPILAADQLDGLLQAECRHQQAMCDGFRHRVRNSHAERRHARAGRLAQGFLQLGADAENLVGIVQRELAGAGQFKPAPAAPEQFDAEAFLKAFDLPGKRLRRQVQFFRCPAHRAGFRDLQEILQVLVVEHGAPGFENYELIEDKNRIFF